MAIISKPAFIIDPAPRHQDNAAHRKSRVLRPTPLKRTRLQAANVMEERTVTTKSIDIPDPTAPRLSHCAGLLLVFLALLAAPSQLEAARSEVPNIVLFLCDDLGYGDLGQPRAGGQRPTPNLDKMAREGMRFTDFLVGRSLCSPSRAALLTGCYPVRVGVVRNFSPKSETGLNPAEITIPELIKIRGYATAIYGKWHLGHAPRFLPTQQGFDEWFGLPYSSDMWPHHPTQPDRYPDLPLMNGERVLNAALQPEDQARLTVQCTERAVEFIRQHRRRPFFIYIPHAMPHVPLLVSDKFKGASDQDLYRDVLREIDWSVGQVLTALKETGVDRRTLVIFTSDNGPWLNYGNHAGSAGPLREGKGTVFEGGFRVPCIMRWPGRIPAGKTCNELATTLDLLPTIASLLRMPLPGDRIIDGKDISSLMFGQPGARSPHNAFYYYLGRNLRAVRSGKWKLVFPHTYNRPDPPGQDGQPGPNTREEIELSLFNLQKDPGERHNIADTNPKTVQRLQNLAEEARVDLGDGIRSGKNNRPLGQ